MTRGDIWVPDIGWAKPCNDARRINAAQMVGSKVNPGFEVFGDLDGSRWSFHKTLAQKCSHVPLRIQRENLDQVRGFS
jgi:hypothetical protein